MNMRLMACILDIYTQMRFKDNAKSREKGFGFKYNSYVARMFQIKMKYLVARTNFDMSRFLNSFKVFSEYKKAF